MASLLAFSALALWSTRASAQPAWRFHLAFENGDGTRDTIWLVFDTSATLMPEVDEALGEGAVEMNLGEFNVWKYNGNGDSTKTEARPYTSFPILYAQVNAFNWQAPVTIRWDTTMFHASYLPETDTIGLASMGGTHFFFYNNDPWLHEFNMMLDDSVVITDPDEVDVLFPISVSIGHGGTAGLPDLQARFLTAWPNPTDGILLLPALGSTQTLSVADNLGRVVMGPMPQPAGNLLDLSTLPDGSYVVRGTTTSNQTWYEKVVKRH